MLGTARLCMRVIRSSFDPDHAPEVNKQSFRYAVHVHSDKPNPADLVRLGTAFNHPLLVFPANLQQGPGPLSRSFAKVSSPGVVLTCLKQAEDGHGLILRLVEYDGQDVLAEVELDPCVVVGFERAEVVDLMERPTGMMSTLQGNRLTVALRAHSFATVRLS
jgi:alpha-mannosidase